LKKNGNNSLSFEHKEKIQVIFHKSMDLLLSRILISLIISQVLLYISY